MSDTELLRRLAEREGVDLDKHRYVTQESGIKPDGTLGCGEGAVRLSDGKPCETHVWYGWNPLTNWSDCGPLIEKHRIQIADSLDGEWLAWQIGTPSVADPDLRRAICLAVDAMEEDK